MREQKKKVLLSVVGILILVFAIVGATYAFFSYVYTGNANSIDVGRISFVTRETKTINLTNAFPISSDNVLTDTTNVGTVEIEVVGDTDYEHGIEYLISSYDSNITTSTGKLVPVSLDIEVTDLGTENDDYFTERENENATIYKQLVGDTLVGDQMLLVGFIKQNTTLGTVEGVNGKITIRAYFDRDKIAITDTYDGTESESMGTTNSWVNNRTVLTTDEWNSLATTGVSFKIRVIAQEGIWVNPSLEEIMNQENIGIDTENGVDFSKTSDEDGTKGVYMRAGTEDDSYPILYYRGAVENNNVMFANQCWKAVRTTDTGGVKLIYNGVPSANRYTLIESDYTLVTNTGNFVFDSTDNTWTSTVTESISSDSPWEISFNVPAGDSYNLEVSGVTSTTGSISLTLYKGTGGVNGTGNGGGGVLSLVHSYGTLTASDVIKVTYAGSGTSDSPSVLKLKMLYPDESLGVVCNNSGSASQITLNIDGTDTNTFAFSGSGLSKSLAYVGYMRGTAYEYINSDPLSGAYYGTGFTWDGTKYTLTSAKTGYDGTHHYTCNLTTAEGTCTSIRYYLSIYDYITLTNGESVENALTKMQENTTNSNAKDKIDLWYANTMTNYTNKLEDTIWCNDRSISSYGGWDPTAGETVSTLYYSPYNRAFITNAPSLVCANKNDAFTVSNGLGNQKLMYPAALLTSDEITLAGNKGSKTSAYYLNSGSSYWSLSPYSGAHAFSVYNTGYMSYFNTDHAVGLRPAISIKPGMRVLSGDGTATSPYQIES